MLAILKDARSSKRPWPEVAFALLELERTGAVDENGDRGSNVLRSKPGTQQTNFAG